MARVVWYSNEIIPGLAVMKLKTEAKIAEIVLQHAIEAKEYMQRHAPWEDRTGAARRGLDTDVDLDVNEYAISLYHTVEYGVYLEVRWGGRYAVVKPAIDEVGIALMVRLTGLLNRI